MKKDLVEIEQKNEVVAVETLIGQAIANNVPVETMERLLAMRKELKAEQAKAAFVGALSNFQKDCPIIKKNKKVMNKDGGSVRYQYASLDSIVDQIRKSLADNNLSYTWDVVHKDNHMVVTAKVTHVLGHFETSTFEIPIDTEGYMTQPQKYASAQTFAKRYTLCNSLGISTGDEDTDATDVGKENTAKSDKAKIIFLLRTLGEPHGTKEEVAKGVKKLAKLELEKGNYGEIVTRLEVLVVEKNQDHEGSKV